MIQIQLFLDTSAMPRRAVKPGQEIDQLIDLATAKLVRIHMSEIAIREWRSQMVEEFCKTVKDMQKSLRAVSYQQLSKGLKQHSVIAQMVSEQESTLKEASEAAGAACTDLLNKLSVEVITIDGNDAADVFDAYFSGTGSFCRPKHRDDIPDAFIYCAAKRFTSIPGVSLCLAACGDGNLHKALSNLKSIQVFRSIKDLLQSDPIKSAIPHLELFQAWTPEKRQEALALLSKSNNFVLNAITEYAENEMSGHEFTEPSLPTDNEEATIDNIYDVEALKVDWEDLTEIGPAWIVAPFEFETDADLSMYIYRMDAFSTPSWINVSLGDFEEHHYFEASAHRRIRVTGHIYFRFTKDELTATPLQLPSSVEIEDVEIEFADNPPDDGEEMDFDPGIDDAE